MSDFWKIFGRFPDFWKIFRCLEDFQIFGRFSDFRKIFRFLDNPRTCDIWDTDYNSDNWEREFMTIFVIWQLIVTLDSIRNSCDVFLLYWFLQRAWSQMSLELSNIILTFGMSGCSSGCSSLEVEKRMLSLWAFNWNYTYRWHSCNRWIINANQLHYIWNKQSMSWRGGCLWRSALDFMGWIPLG